MRPTGHDPDRHLARRVGIKVRVQIASAEDCHEVDPSSVFHTGDRIRLLVEPNIDGYLYILQTGSSGKESMLFPHPDINDGQNEVMRGRLYSVPSSGSFTFRDPAGQEVLKVILSRTPLQSLPADAPSGNNVQLAMNSVNNELAARVRSRDLVYESETGPTRKGTPGVPTQAVIWLNTNPDDNNVVHFDLKLKHEAKRP